MPHPIDPGTVLNARSLALAGSDDRTRVWMRPTLSAADEQTLVLHRPEKLATGSSPEIRPMPAKPSRLASGSSPALEMPTARGGHEAPAPVEVFSLIRRIALQRDLANATGVLHAGLAELVCANIVLVQVLDAGKVTSPAIEDLRNAAKLIPLAGIVETHRRRQRYIAERLVMVPLATMAPTVLVAYRTPNQPAFEPLALRLLGQACARLAVLDHFLALAAQTAEQAAADRESVFRAEALAASRGDRRECELVDLSPRTLRLSIPLLALVAAVLVAIAAIVHVPTYSRGVGVVKMSGQNVIANTSGPVVERPVVAGQHVSVGDALLVLDTTTERQAFEHIDTVYRDQLSAHLFDESDEVARQSLTGIIAQRKAALDALAAKTIRATIDGTVGELLSPDLVQSGEQVATIVPDDAARKIVAYMPGTDKPSITPGMEMQVEMVGYPGSRVTVTITDVGTEAISGEQARKYLGQKMGSAVALPPSAVRVEAELSQAEFESRGKTFTYSEGMEALVEIEIDTKSFLSVVIPTGD